jgi:putative membrane protein insertion efficiency factor
MKRFALWMLGIYKRWISPSLPPSCRYVPTCSEYSMEAVERYGVLRGGVMGAWRLLRCHPFVKGGYDPVVKCSKRQETQQAASLRECKGKVGNAWVDRALTINE